MQAIELEQSAVHGHTQESFRLDAEQGWPPPAAPRCLIQRKTQLFKFLSAKAPFISLLKRISLAHLVFL